METQPAVEAKPKKPTRPLWYGLNALALDMGLAGMVTFALGFGGVAANQSFADHPIVSAVLLLISVYAAYFLRRRYTNKFEALLGLLSFAVFVNATLTAVTPQVMDMVVLGTIGQLVAYGLGWELAAKKKVNILLPNKGWLTAFLIVGYTIIALAFLTGLGLFFR